MEFVNFTLSEAGNHWKVLRGGATAAGLRCTFLPVLVENRLKRRRGETVSGEGSQQVPWTIVGIQVRGDGDRGDGDTGQTWDVF